MAFWAPFSFLVSLGAQDSFNHHPCDELLRKPALQAGNTPNILKASKFVKDVPSTPCCRGTMTLDQFAKVTEDPIRPTTSRVFSSQVCYMSNRQA